jgi:hypothetical protein
MSIAAISSYFATAVRRSAAPAAVEAADPVSAPARVGREQGREQGRRHELVAAMNQVLGLPPSDGEPDKKAEQAVFRFAHALMHDLRTMVGEDSDGPRAWGRRDWADLSQRLQALATAAMPAAAAAVAAETQAPTAEVPDQPNPVTTATAAVHIMKVPSSHLLEAFAAMQRALGELDQGADPTDERSVLAALANRLAAAVAPTAASALPAGSVVNLSA